MSGFSLDHVQIAMPEGEEEAARAFWGALVGLAEIEKPEALRARGGVWFQLQGAELHLGVETPFVPAKKAHPCLVTSELDELAARLKDAGHSLRWDGAIAWRERFFTEDPFGNRLEFMQAHVDRGSG